MPTKVLFCRAMDHAMPAGDGTPLPDDPATDRREGCACPRTLWESRLLMPHAEMAFGLCARVVKQAEEANRIGSGGDTMFARISHTMQVSIALKGFDVPTDPAALTRLASLGTLSRDAEEGKDATAGIVGAPCSLSIRPADDDGNRPGSGHDPP